MKYIDHMSWCISQNVGKCRHGNYRLSNARGMNYTRNAQPLFLLNLFFFQYFKLLNF